MATAPRESYRPPRGRRIASRYVNTGFYPGYDVLDNQGHWDTPTWEAIRKRMEQVPEIRFFTPDERDLYAAVCDVVVGQDAARDPWTVPIVNFLDEKLFLNHTDGYRFAGMPPMREAFRAGARALDLSASILFSGRRLATLARADQKEVIAALARHEPPGHLWATLNPKHFWHVLTVSALHIFYAHPYLWNEIGFGGPVYPLGYARITNGEPDPWEKHEDRAA